MSGNQFHNVKLRQCLGFCNHYPLGLRRWVMSTALKPQHGGPRVDLCLVSSLLTNPALSL